MLDHCSVDVNTGRPDDVDIKSRPRCLEPVAASTMTSTTTTDHQPLQLPLALLRMTNSRTGACPGRTVASSTPRGRVLDLRAGRCHHERPDSALSNFSELDSGYDELRSFTVTPIIPPELVITGPQETHLDLLPEELTSSSAGIEPEVDGKDRNEDDNKSISEESDLYQSEAFPEDRCNTSSIAEHEELLSTNTGTGNSSAVSISSLDAADGCRLSANTSECEILLVYST